MLNCLIVVNMQNYIQFTAATSTKERNRNNEIDREREREKERTERGKRENTKIKQINRKLAPNSNI